MHAVLKPFSLVIASLALILISPTHANHRFRLRWAAQAQNLQAQVTTAREWRRFVSVEGGFTVEMPGTPTVRLEPADPTAGVGESGRFLLKLRSGQGAYGVNYIELPNISSQLNSDEIDQLLDILSDGVIKNGQVLAERSLTLEGHPGREIEVAGAGEFYKARTYWVYPRAYTLLITVNTQTDLIQAGDRFLDSFGLVTSSAADLDTQYSRSPDL
ncbi:MAG: hypothetical protein F6K19_39140 [Cyanothece sp. SIO1E1]|nr:hypothetical protein [Cyanothece sp. SIO1E1]